MGGGGGGGRGGEGGGAGARPPPPHRRRHPPTPPLPLLGDPGSARVRARAPLAPPIVVQQVELVSCGATCWKGKEAPCGGSWEREQVRPGSAWPAAAKPNLVLESGI